VVFIAPPHNRVGVLELLHEDAFLSFLDFFLLPPPPVEDSPDDDESEVSLGRVGDDDALSCPAAGATGGDEGVMMLLREVAGPTLMRFKNEGFLA
jgi:hypothetical protein